MSEENKITFDNIYRSLRAHDKALLKHFNDKELSDQDYLFYAINSDIISNTLNVIMALETDNVDSVGVDNSCRTIIEAFVVLRMIAEGAISDEQAKIFRYHYAIVDFGNMRKIVDDRVKEQKDYQYVNKDRKKAFEAILKFHNCTMEELMKNKDFDDSNFYLKKHLKEKINFAALLKEYPVFNFNALKMYDFFSIFVHPRYEKNIEVESAIRGLRDEYINQIIAMVTLYMKDTKLFIFDESLNTFKNDFYDNPLLIGNVQNINDIRNLFENIKAKTCYFDDGVDGFTMFFLDRIREIIIDMDVSMTFGYKEHVISLFKSAMEYIAFYVAVNETESLEEFKKMKLAYCYTSRLQLDNLIRVLTKESMVGEETENGLKQLYEEYYKDKYQLDSYEEFKKNMRKNARYFLFKNDNSFNRIVNGVIDDLYNDLRDRDYIKMIYKISKDMNHGGGYAFNSSPGLIDSQCRRARHFIFRYMLLKLQRMEETLKEHNVEVNLTFEKKFFEVLSTLETIEINKVDEEYGHGNTKE